MRTITPLACSFLLICAVSWAQTSQINGIIKDSTGLAIPGAAIKVTQTATGVVRTVTSGADGGYVLANLASDGRSHPARRKRFYICCIAV